MRNLLLAGLIITNVIALAQKTEPGSETYILKSKRFIDKVEVFGGPSLSFNHGNKLVDNYNDGLITNKRFMKVGYTFGLSVYHRVKDRLTLNARILFDQKGTKSELNSYSYTSRSIVNSEYSYNYLTIFLAPNFLIGKHKNISISLGGYFSKIKSVKGFASTYDTQGTVPPTAGSFIGRYWYAFDNNGGINSFTFIPGLQSFEQNDFGLTLGLAYQIHIESNHIISLKLTDNYGLHNVYNGKITENMPEKNHSLSLTLGYIFSRYEKEIARN
jgi:hypothetical protein